MPLGLKDLINNYSSAVKAGNAALFMGAGMSRDAGFVHWKALMRPYAERLGLKVDKENDLVAVAQYYLNSKNGERSFLNQALVDEFDRPSNPVTPSHEIIARLPIATIWTTNYDKLIEDAFKVVSRYPDVKFRDEDLGFSRNEREGVLYKMHGDISQPDKVIICKEDYERYPRTHPVFQSTLTSHLLTKKFLFLGLSFDDPNLNYTLGHLYSLLEKKKRGHYLITRYARRNFHKDESREDFEYKQRKQVLQVDDLQRYGIETILVDQFWQVAEILEVLEQRIKGNGNETLILPSEQKARERFDNLMTAGLVEKLKSQYSDTSKEELADIVYDVAKVLVEKETGINIEHIERI